MSYFGKYIPGRVDRRTAALAPRSPETGAAMTFGKTHRTRRRISLRSGDVLLTGDRLMVEPLERRDMLSATVGAYADETGGGHELTESIDGGEVIFCRAFFPPPMCWLPEGFGITEPAAPPDVERNPDGIGETLDDPLVIVDPIVTDPIAFDPTLEEYLDFVRRNPTWPEDHGAGGIQLQVITPSSHLPWIEFGTPGEARAFDAWYGETLLSVTPPEGDQFDPVLVVIPEALRDFPASDPDENADVWLLADAEASTTDEPARAFASASASSGAHDGWMAAFAANFSGAGAEATQPVTGRRRGPAVANACDSPVWSRGR